MTLPGDRPRLYNTPALMTASDQIAICEGELDTVTAAACGLDAVGVPGVEAWQPHFAPAFLGYERVYLLADNDDSGQGLKFAERIAGELPNARVVLMPHGHDVNSLVMQQGKRSLLERITD
ncbi:toprim domain-containing protein [Kutzneria chonburiensis]|uniref:Toprim domain-containing protein n=2 Tax=Kutzneria chonburiensis TaxID=1483604 RepID=A0ABV6N3C8_9PSEU